MDILTFAVIAYLIIGAFVGIIAATNDREEPNVTVFLIGLFFWLPVGLLGAVFELLSELLGKVSEIRHR